MGGGGVGDFLGAGDVGRGDPGRDVDGLSPGLGVVGRTNGSGFSADVEARGAIFNGGGGIIGMIPLLWSTLVITGRDIDISGPSLGAGALRLTTFGTPAFDFSVKKIIKLHCFSFDEFP